MASQAEGWLTEVAEGEITARAGVDVGPARSTASALRLDWLWTDEALRHDGWRDLGGGRWAPVPADERSEWTTPERGECWAVDAVAGSPTPGSGGGAAGAGDGGSVGRELADAHAWAMSWTGADGWLVRHAARMKVVGRMARLEGVLSGRVEMAKAKSGLTLSSAARKELVARAAGVELTPERYLDVLLTRSPEGALDGLVNRSLLEAAKRRVREWDEQQQHRGGKPVDPARPTAAQRQEGPGGLTSAHGTSP